MGSGVSELFSRNGFQRILGFLMTSPKFKQRNYRFFCLFTFMRYCNSETTLFIQFSTRKGSSFCERGRMNFQSFALRSIQMEAGKALVQAKNVIDFFKFCFPSPKMNISLIFMSSPSTRKTERQMFLLVSSRHICALQWDTKDDVSIQTFINFGKIFFRVSRL